MRSLVKWTATAVIVVATLVGCSQDPRYPHIPDRPNPVQPATPSAPNIEDTIEPDDGTGYTGRSWMVPDCNSESVGSPAQGDDPVCATGDDDGAFQVWMADGSEMYFDVCPDESGEPYSWCVDPYTQGMFEVYK